MATAIRTLKAAPDYKKASILLAMLAILIVGGRSVLFRPASAELTPYSGNYFVWNALKHVVDAVGTPGGL